MKIDEKVFEKVTKHLNGQFMEISLYTTFSEFLRTHARHVLTNYLAEIEKPICIKKIKKNTMIIRAGK